MIAPGSIFNSIELALWTCFFSLVISLLICYSLVVLSPPGKKIFQILFPLSISIPLYVSAFLYHGLIEYSSPLSIFFRDHLNINLQWLVGFKSIPFIAFVFALTLFPYIYLYLMPVFQKYYLQYRPLAYSLKITDINYFKKIIFPLTSPWILSSLAIIGMEVLADFGGVTVYNLETLTTQIYLAWTGLFSIKLAIKLSFLLLSLSLFFNFTNQLIIPKYQHSLKTPVELVNLSSKFKSYLGFAICFIFLCLSLLFPLGYLLYLLWSEFSMEYTINLTPVISFSMELAIIVALVTCSGNLVSIFFLRKSKNFFSQTYHLVSQIGYAMPGIAIAILFIYLSNFIKKFLSNFSLEQIYLGMLFLGLIFRFSIFANKHLNQSIQSIKNNYFHLAENLKIKKRDFFPKILIPILAPSIMSAFYFVFIEVLKEMPLTLMLKPAQVNTLATKIFEFTSEGEWGKAALPSFLLIVLSMLGQIIIFRRLKRARS